MATDTVVRPVVSTAAPEKTKEQIAAEALETKRQSDALAVVLEWKPATFVTNFPVSLENVDTELNEGFRLQTEQPNETDFRINYLETSIVAANKARARANAAAYDAMISKWTKLPCYIRTHTREQVEAAFLASAAGKIMAEIKNCSLEYLENHK